jgi:hypothetical protein
MAKDRLKSRTPAAGTCQLTRNDPLLNTIDVCSEAPWPFLHSRRRRIQFLKNLQQFLRCSKHRNIYWLYHATVFDLKHRNRNRVEIRSRHGRIHAAIGKRSQGQRNRDYCYQISWLIAIKQLIEKPKKKHWIKNVVVTFCVSIDSLHRRKIRRRPGCLHRWVKYLFKIPCSLCREYKKATALQRWTKLTAET